MRLSTCLLKKPMLCTEWRRQAFTSPRDMPSSHLSTAGTEVTLAPRVSAYTHSHSHTTAVELFLNALSAAVTMGACPQLSPHQSSHLVPTLTIIYSESVISSRCLYTRWYNWNIWSLNIDSGSRKQNDLIWVTWISFSFASSTFLTMWKRWKGGKIVFTMWQWVVTFLYDSYTFQNLRNESAFRQSNRCSAK